MGNIFEVYKRILGGVLKVAGVRPQIVEIEPGTVLNFWVPNETPKKSRIGNPAENKQRKPKPAVVFLHPFAMDGIFIWQFQVLALGRNYRVYVPDLLFFGGSTTDKSDRSPAFQAECVAKGLRKLGVERCTLVALSYGGMVGFKMAEMYPHLVESMVVTCSVMALTESIKDGILERVGFESLAELLLPDSVKDLESLSGFLSYQRLPMPSFFYIHYLEHIYGYFQAMFNNRKESFSTLWSSTTRTSCQLNIHRQLGDGTTLEYIEKAGHAVQMERPWTYNKHLKEILATLMEEGQKEQ